MSKAKKEEESQTNPEDLLAENEVLKQAYESLDKDYQKLLKENEQLKKKTSSKAEPKAGPEEPGIIGKLQKDKAELVEFLQLFRNRNEFKQALFELANCKEFYWLLDKHNKPVVIPTDIPLPTP